MEKKQIYYLGFKKYIKKPNTINYGTLYTKEVNMPFSKENKRTLRVFLPEEYDGTKRFPVLYFSDGQNMVDKYTTAYGSWEVDEINHELSLKGKTPFILVGLDCPKNGRLREAEYMPDLGKTSFFHKSAGSFAKYGEKTAEFFVDKIKPLIDKTFLTLSDRENTGFCGSSMGGLFSFYICNRFTDVFGICLSYSPAFMLYKDSTLKKYIASLTPNKVKISLYCGKKSKLEYALYKNTNYFVKELRKVGFNENRTQYFIDKKAWHHESCWHKQMMKSFEFLLNK